MGETNDPNTSDAEDRNDDGGIVAKIKSLFSRD
jgi:hypothetical protein